MDVARDYEAIRGLIHRYAVEALATHAQFAVLAHDVDRPAAQHEIASSEPLRPWD